MSYSSDNNSNYDVVMGKIDFHHVDGENKGDIKLFALSTCGWCKQTRMWLEENEIAYDYVYVDLSSGDQRNDIMIELEKYNPDVSFPTIVINGTTVIVGYEPDKIAEDLGISA